MGRSGVFRLLVGFFLMTAYLYGMENAAVDEDVEYAISGLREGGMGKDAYYDALGMPNLYVDTVCEEHCSRHCCYNVLRDRAGRIVRRFSRSDSITQVARNRYRGVRSCCTSVVTKRRVGGIPVPWNWSTTVCTATMSRRISTMPTPRLSAVTARWSRSTRKASGTTAPSS